jgi:hypothetical protein
MKNEMLKKVQELCDGINYNRDVPEEAKKLAKENNIVIIVGGSDDLMYCYGAESYLADCVEHSEGWDGCDLAKDACDKQLQEEAKQLGLKIWWCGEIINTGEKREGHSINESGAFSYSVNDNIQSLDFKVMEENGDVYCIGKVIQLPEDFKSYKG